MAYCHSDGDIRTSLTVFQDSPSSLEYCLSKWSNTTLHICFASFPSEFAFSYDDKKKLQTTHCDFTSLLKFAINVTFIFFLHICIYSLSISYMYTMYFDNNHAQTLLQDSPVNKFHWKPTVPVITYVDMWNPTAAKASYCQKLLG